MVIIENLEQGTVEWFVARAGRVTASRAYEFSMSPNLAPFPDIDIVKDGKINRCVFEGKVFENTNKLELQKAVRESLPAVYPDMRNGYLNELIAQVCTQEFKEQGTFKQTEWGKENEDIARAVLGFKLGVEVDEVGFIYKDENKRAGISPDGIIKELNCGAEIKCPFDTKYHIDFLLDDKIKPEYIEQCQFSMWVTGFTKWIFASYDPRMKKADSRLKFVEIERDEVFMKKYDEAYSIFISEMDMKLESIGFTFNDIYN